MNNNSLNTVNPHFSRISNTKTVAQFAKDIVLEENVLKNAERKIAEFTARIEANPQLPFYTERQEIRNLEVLADQSRATLKANQTGKQVLKDLIEACRRGPGGGGAAYPAGLSQANIGGASISSFPGVALRTAYISTVDPNSFSTMVFYNRAKFPIIYFVTFFFFLVCFSILLYYIILVTIPITL